MRLAQRLYADVSVHGSQTRLRGVKAAGVEDRPWISSFPVCAILNQYRIAHVGVMEAAAPYQIVRTKQTSTYFVACYGGRGEVLIDGRWRECRPGMAFLLPAHILNAFHAAPGARWEFCWVCYVQPNGQRRIWDSASPVLARYDYVPLLSAILGLIHECQGPSAPAILQHWVELVQEYVWRFAKPDGRDPRLMELWARVEAHLGEDWSLGRLALEAGYSREHLRRLCRQELGRSPVHQVLHLRMRRAAELLSSTNEKVEAVADAVGYADPFVFSKAFHRCIGWPPSEYRVDRRVAAEKRQRGPRTRQNGGVGKRALLLVLLLASLLKAGAAEQSALPASLPEPQPAVAVYAQRARSAPSAAANASSNSAAQEDRKLREEQLEAARQLGAELPGNADAAYVSGCVASEQGDSAAAIRHWEEALRLEAASMRLYTPADACYSLGYACLLREEFEKAVAFLRRSLELNPRRPETRYRLAHALFLAGSMEESLRVLDDGKVESALACRLRGQANQQLGKLEEARRNYEQTIRLNPNFAEAYYGLATVCARLGHTAKADEYRRKFDSLKAEGQKSGRQARTDYDPLALTRRSLAETHTQIARVYAAQGQTAKAEGLLLRAAEASPENTACRFQLVMLYQQARRNQEALRFCLEMIRVEPENAFHYLASGNLQLRLQQQPGAEAAFRKVIELAPNRAEGYFALAQLYLQTNGHDPEALRLAEQAVNLAPSPVNYYVLSQACARNADLPGAMAAIEKACALDPSNAQYRNWRASLRDTKHE